MAEFSLRQQIEEVKLELSYRDKVYRRMVERGQMKQSMADYRTRRMQAVLDTLETLDTSE